jgi:hypothetical protein
MSDYINPTVWLFNQINELRLDINSYIESGMDKKTAVELVFDNNCVSNTAKLQIRCEFN